MIWTFSGNKSDLNASSEAMLLHHWLCQTNSKRWGLFEDFQHSILTDQQVHSVTDHSCPSNCSSSKHVADNKWNRKMHRHSVPRVAISSLWISLYNAEMNISLFFHTTSIRTVRPGILAWNPLKSWAPFQDVFCDTKQYVTKIFS